MKRASFQSGSVVRKSRVRGPDVWVFRYMQDGVRKSQHLGTVDRFRTKAAAQKEANRFRDEINQRLAGITVAGLCDRFERDGMDVRSHTAATYRTFLNRVRTDWGSSRIDDLGRNLIGVEAWINDLQTLGRKGYPPRPMSKKTKLHVKAFLHLLFESAMRWNLYPVQRNPMGLLKVKGKRVRVRTITLLTGDQYRAIIADPALCDHVRTMVQVAMLLGLRASEILGLRWEDIDFAGRTISIRRSFVDGKIDETKTAESAAELPLHDDLAAILETWKHTNQSINGWLFGSALTGRPFWRGMLQRDHLVPAGKKVGILSLGWHDFRHTYRAMMGELGISLELQQTLMRHADISTTLSYGQKSAADKTRPANAQVVEMMRRMA